jgi:ubiquinone/menaquinone biosynthesis C-methylase UbiE
MAGEDHSAVVEQAFSAQAASFNSSAVANADDILDMIVDHARPQHSERWLEAACGPGIVSRRLAPHVAAVHGVDVTAAMVEIARSQAVAAGLRNATFEVADATATKLDSAGFDGAVTRFSIHHIPTPDRLMRELARVVRPGGKIIVVDHLADDDADTRSWSQEIERLRDPSHWTCLGADQMRAIGERAGLCLEREHRFKFELDFDDWLDRGTSSPQAQDLVNDALIHAPQATECFKIVGHPGHRTLTLLMWLGLWRRP